MIDPQKYRKAQYLKAADLTHVRTRVRIHSVGEEEVGTPAEVKLVMQFTTATLKPFVLNFTNVDALVQHFGPEEKEWIGKVIVLFKTTAIFKGDRVPAIRIEFPLQPAADVPPPPATPAGFDEQDLA